MDEYIQYFGGMHIPKYSIEAVQADNNGGKAQTPFTNSKGSRSSSAAPTTAGKTVTLRRPDINGNHSLIIKIDHDFTLYLHMKLFFANGGGTCYVVSAGNYEKALEKSALESAIISLEKVSEPTMLVIPEATNLKAEECYELQEAMAVHCGGKMKNRISIIDVFINRYPDDSREKVDYVKNFREGFSTNCPSFVAVYYPYLETSILSDNDVTSEMIDLGEDSDTVLKEFGVDDATIKTLKTHCSKGNDNSKVEMCPFLHQFLLQTSVIYKSFINIIRRDLQLLPPSAAIAGVYTTVDNTRGVWKSPANVAIKSVKNPSIIISDYEQQELNAPMSGKFINAIRVFPGEGVKVWGARTFDGNSQDWRYVNVRRTMLFLEGSIKNAVRACACEPNNANTWSNVKSMIESFLRSVWKRGGLAGTMPEDAFEVHVGLGDTMTDDDIVAGIMRITVLVAISHPAEFLEITFQQQMLKN